MAVLKFREAAGEAEKNEPTIERAIISDGMPVEWSEKGAPTATLRMLPPPTDDLAAKLEVADAAISAVEELLGKVRTSQDELRQAMEDLKRERDDWRTRAERVTERPWWRRLAG